MSTGRKAILLGVAVVLVAGLLIAGIRLRSDVQEPLADIYLQLVFPADNRINLATITMLGDTSEDGEVERVIIITPGKTEILPFKQINAGVWPVQVQLYDEVGGLIRSGEAEISVAAGSISTAHVVFLDQDPELKVNVYTVRLPQEPQNVTAMYEDGVVVIGWDEVEGAVGYRVWCSYSENWTGVFLNDKLILATRAMDETGLRCGWGTTYYYRVVAYDENDLASHPSEAASITLDVESAEGWGDPTVYRQTLYSMDFELLYFIDTDINFLMMKGIGQRSKGREYYVDPHTKGYETRFYLADDKYTIDRITLISKEEGFVGSGSFMGLYLGMAMEDAKDYLQTESLSYNGELKVNYLDRYANGRIDQIDVISLQVQEKRVNREDFYFKFFDMDIHEQVHHIGDGTGAPTTLDIDPENRTYTYTITYGDDVYQKVYAYNEDDAIISMEIRSMQPDFIAVVPSLFGIPLGSQKVDIPQMVSAADKTIHASYSKETLDSDYAVKVYTVIDNPSKIVYTAVVYTDRDHHSVQKIKGYMKERTVVSHDHLSLLVGEELGGSAQRVEGTGSEKWEVRFEAYHDLIIRSVSLYKRADSIFIDTVPSLYGLQLNMFAMSAPSILQRNGFTIINEKRYWPFVDQNLGTVAYTVVHPETNRESRVYINTQQIPEISAAIVFAISIN